MAHRLPGTLFLRNLVERRSLLFQLVRRDFEQRFVGSAIGWIWGLIQPLVQLACWVFVFQYCLGNPGGTQNFALFVFAGMLPWMLFSETVQRSASSVVEHANLITKTVFPAEIVPVAVFLSALIGNGMALSLAVAAVGFSLHRLSALLLLLPVYFLVIGLLAVGLGWIVAALHVFLRDTAQLVNVALLCGFWLTPIMVPEERFQKWRWARALLFANPLTYMVRGYRAILLGQGQPRAEDLGIAAVWGLAVFVAGGLFFRHMKRGFADVL
jgi:ABC-type polysaccharide/polyol phosphate export permease